MKKTTPKTKTSSTKSSTAASPAPASSATEVTESTTPGEQLEELFAGVDRELDWLGKNLEDAAGGNLRDYEFNAARCNLLTVRGHLRDVRDTLRHLNLVTS